jgi:hypothetical protein
MHIFFRETYILYFMFNTIACCSDAFQPSIFVIELMFFHANPILKAIFLSGIYSSVFTTAVNNNRL